MRPYLEGYGAWLRTSSLEHELGWDGFDTAMHELGHNLEQLCSTYFVSRPALRGVPNTACTEAFAFLYQSLAKRVLGLEDAAEAERQFAVDSVATMLSACQIAGPSLLELRAWRWLYANPTATPAALRAEVLRIAEDLWKRFYERDFGQDPYRILAAYQHMIAHPLYLPDYTLGHMMSHQIRSYMRGKDLAGETKRITSLGCLTPDLWMRKAVGSPVSAAPLAQDAATGLRLLG
jgi:oligoendopeptidase F